MNENYKRKAQLQTELDRWLELLKNQYQPQKIIVFGSFANGTVREWSDLDLIIIKDTDKPFLDRTKDLLLLLRPKVGVDLFVYTASEFKDLCEKRVFFKDEINKNGITVYERRI